MGLSDNGLVNWTWGRLCEQTVQVWPPAEAPRLSWTFTLQGQGEGCNIAEAFVDFANHIRMSQASADEIDPLKRFHVFVREVYKDGLGAYEGIFDADGVAAMVSRFPWGEVWITGPEKALVRVAVWESVLGNKRGRRRFELVQNLPELEFIKRL